MVNVSILANTSCIYNFVLSQKRTTTHSPPHPHPVVPYPYMNLSLEQTYPSPIFEIALLLPYFV